MTSGISSTINGLYYIDVINNSNKEKDEDNKSVEDIFGEILDQISENLEKQIDKNNDLEQTDSAINKSFNFGPPIGLCIEGLDETEF